MIKNPKARLVTLGCARNDVDSEELAGRLAVDGWSLAGEDDEADIVVVNTCGFIESAKAESVDTIMSATGTKVPVVAVGCMAERYGKELATAMPEASAVIGFDGYEDISDRLHRVLDGEDLPSHAPRDRRELLPLSPVERPGLSTPPGHGAAVPSAGVDFAQRPDATQIPSSTGVSLALPSAGTTVLRRRLGGGPVASLKIASGCDRRCAFCAIPRFRGAFISRTPDEILAEARWLADHGVVEAVLVSENSTSYGKDLGKPRELESVLVGLGEILPRVRVSYLQPAETRPTLIEVIAKTPNVADYFDMSFQHASGPLLRAMRRFGDKDSFLAMVDQIRGFAPRAGVRSNVIVGFPGETEADVAQLIDFVNAAQMDAVGVFGYSDEEDTEGARLSGKLDSDEIAARVAEVNVAVEHSTADRAGDRIGDRATVLVEAIEGGEFRGRAEHQGPEDADTTVSGQATVGDLVDVVFTQSSGVDLYAEKVATS